MGNKLFYSVGFLFMFLVSEKVSIFGNVHLRICCCFLFFSFTHLWLSRKSLPLKVVKSYSVFFSKNPVVSPHTVGSMIHFEMRPLYVRNPD